MIIREWRGVRDLVYAHVISDTSDGITFGSVKKLAGTSQIVKSTDASNEAHYYNNVPAVIVSGVGADTVTIDTSAINNDIIADLTGQFYDSATGMFVEQEATPPDIAIGYVTNKTDGTEVFVWRLKGKVTLGDTTHQTKDNSTTANGQQVTYTGISTTYKFSKTNKPAKAVNISTDNNPAEVTEAAFFASVQTPDTVGGTVDVTGVGIAPSALTVETDSTAQLIATVIPTNATNKAVTWSVTSGGTYASVSSDGLVTGLSAGTATVTVTTVDGSFTDTCTVTVETSA